MALSRRGNDMQCSTTPAMVFRHGKTRAAPAWSRWRCAKSGSWSHGPPALRPSLHRRRRPDGAPLGSRAFVLRGQAQERGARDGGRRPWSDDNSAPGMPRARCHPLAHSLTHSLTQSVECDCHPCSSSSSNQSPISRRAESTLSLPWQTFRPTLMGGDQARAEVRMRCLRRTKSHPNSLSRSHSNHT